MASNQPRKTDGTNVPSKSPPVKVVGFHVEGAAPSPRDTALEEAIKLSKNAAGSPSPVIIPPAFNQDKQQQAGDAASPQSASKKQQPLLPPTIPESTKPPPPEEIEKQRQQQQQQQLPKTSPRHESAPPAVMLAPSPSRHKEKKQEGQQQGEGKEGDVQPAAAAAAATTASQPPPPQPKQPPQNQAPPKKQMSRAERRQIQEQQRAAKAGKTNSSNTDGAPAVVSGSKDIGLGKSSSNVNLGTTTTTDGPSTGTATHHLPSTTSPSPSTSSPVTKQYTTQRKISSASSNLQPQHHNHHHQQQPNKATELFAHLQQFKKIDPSTLLQRAATGSVPAKVVRLALQMADGTVIEQGANARVVAMLAMFADLIGDFKVPPGKDFVKELTPAFNNAISVLVMCRPLSASMGNAIKCIKSAIERLKLQPEVTEGEARGALLELISCYSQEKIKFATEVLVRHAVPLIAQSGDLLVTYSFSSTVLAVLLAAKKAGRRFSVVVVDSRPHLEGRGMLRQLLAAKISCEYVHLNGLSFALGGGATKVILGAGGVLSNGTVLARAGSAAVSMAAAAANIPVLVCSETHKFHERVQLDSITHNELGDPDQVMDTTQQGSSNISREKKKLSALQLVYDATPAEYVSVVVTEVGAVPPTSVPAVLREYNKATG
jgi:translation initiation factor eIF-2B subunit delta